MQQSYFFVLLYFQASNLYGLEIFRYHLRSESLTSFSCLSFLYVNLVNQRQGSLLEELGVFYKLDSSPEPVSPSPESRSSSSSSYQPGIHSSEAFPSIHSQAFEACNNTSGTQPITPANPLRVMPRSTFSTCGNFLENAEISEAKWLRKFDFDIKDCQDAKGPFPPDRYLRYLDMLLIENASNWSESNPKAIRLLAEPEMTPTQQIIQQFRAVFCERFPSKAVKATSIPSDIEITELRQRPEETLSTYYKRVLNLMQRVRAKDRPASTPNTAFTLLESSMLDIIRGPSFVVLMTMRSGKKQLATWHPLIDLCI